MDINNKVTIITGASAGIGMATARLFAAQGARVVLAARSMDQLEQLAGELRQAGGQALVIGTDMRDAASILSMVEQVARHFGRVDILINNAGQSIAGMVADVSLDEVRQIYELNIFGVMAAMQAAIPLMRAGGGGVIVNISSMTSKMALPGLAGYASTKAALNLITQTARAELAADNIRVLLVLPRTTTTEFGKHALGDRQLRERQRAHATRPGGPIVDTPEYVAARILEAVENETAEKYMDTGA